MNPIAKDPPRSQETADVLTMLYVSTIGADDA
jgi:hypothetical protein